VTVESLAMIEQAEGILREAGFYDVRVRHHKGLARIEVGPAELTRFFDTDLRQRVTDEFKKIGYAYVTLDLQGYRRGSAQELLQKEMSTR
jgi:uncharacterized protein